MKYPRLPHDSWASVKLTLRDIEQIRNLFYRRQNTDYEDLAMSFGVSVYTIKYWLDPFFHFTEIDRNTDKFLDNYYNTPGFKEYAADLANKRKRNRYDTDPKYREYLKQIRIKITPPQHTRQFRHFMRLVELQ